MGPRVRIHSLGLNLDKTERVVAEETKEDIEQNMGLIHMVSNILLSKTGPAPSGQDRTGRNFHFIIFLIF